MQTTEVQISFPRAYAYVMAASAAANVVVTSPANVSTTDAGVMRGTGGAVGLHHLSPSAAWGAVLLLVIMFLGLF